MKKYKLLKWYPSLPKDWEAGKTMVNQYQCEDTTNYVSKVPYSCKFLGKMEVENQPEYWAKYLFTTQDSINVYHGDIYYLVNSFKEIIKMHPKVHWSMSYADGAMFENQKTFSTKEAAQKYIDENDHQEKLKELQKKFPVGSTVRLINDKGMNAKYGNLATVKKCYFDEGSEWFEPDYTLDVEWDRSTGTTQYNGGYYARDFEPVETKSITVVVNGVIASTTFNGDSCEIKYV